MEQNVTKKQLRFIYISISIMSSLSLSWSVQLKKLITLCKHMNIELSNTEILKKNLTFWLSTVIIPFRELVHTLTRYRCALIRECALIRRCVLNRIITVYVQTYYLCNFFPSLTFNFTFFLIFIERIDST